MRVAHITALLFLYSFSYSQDILIWTLKSSARNDSQSNTQPWSDRFPIYGPDQDDPAFQEAMKELELKDIFLQPNTQYTYPLIWMQHLNSQYHYSLFYPKSFIREISIEADDQSRRVLITKDNKTGCFIESIAAYLADEVSFSKSLLIHSVISITFNDNKKDLCGIICSAELLLPNDKAWKAISLIKLVNPYGVYNIGHRDLSHTVIIFDRISEPDHEFQFIIIKFRPRVIDKLKPYEGD